MASGNDVAFASAVSLLDLYRRKALSPVEATRLIFDRLDALQPKINAFCVMDRDGALAAARASEGRWWRGEAVGRLDGVPVTVKDLILMRGFPTRRGSRLVEPDQDWSEDAPATARLREAGAVIIGKTTTPEFGWKALGDSPLTGITRNPWDLSRTPGGSTAGAAAACAAGIGPLHVGSDGAGSIRIPSAFTGVFGLKPSFGRVPAHPPSPMGLLAHIGPMARTVADAALLLTVLSGPDHRDPYALPPEDKDYAAGLEEGVRGWRIAYSPTLGYARVNPEIAAATAEAARQFEALGAIVEQVDAIFDSPRDALFTLWAAGAAKILAGFPADRDHPQSLGPLAHSRRKQRRSSGGLCRRDRAVARRQRRCRLDPHPERLYRRLRIEAEFWPGACPSSFPDGHLGAYWPDGPNCHGRGAVADRPVGPRPPRSLCSAARQQGLRGGTGGRGARLADCLQSNPRLHQGRT
jgi:aspartyl-tRNA(Asn)/glutamyl-tRNA(Gln) amidotransferase subunit A